jgi:hypothetical protein
MSSIIDWHPYNLNLPILWNVHCINIYVSQPYARRDLARILHGSWILVYHINGLESKVCIRHVLERLIHPLSIPMEDESGRTSDIYHMNNNTMESLFRATPGGETQYKDNQLLRMSPQTFDTIHTLTMSRSTQHAWYPPHHFQPGHYDSYAGIIWYWQ